MSIFEEKKKGDFKEKLKGYSYVISRKGDERLKKVYSLYLKLFTLTEERESYEGFESVLELMDKEFLFDTYGKWEEGWIVLEDPDSGIVIGALNFDNFSTPGHILSNYSISGTCHIIYLFVHPSFRKLGVGKILLDLLYSRAEGFSQSKNVIYFCEQNNPELMDKSSYSKDKIGSEIDPKERLKWWENRGYHVLDFRYVQPSLEKGKKPCKWLTLNVRSEDRSCIPSEIIIEHLKRFFEISIFKGKDATNDETFAMQIEELMKKKEIKII
jgi:GNAT superfamily N-acetyltransferase